MAAFILVFIHLDYCIQSSVRFIDFSISDVSEIIARLIVINPSFFSSANLEYLYWLPDQHFIRHAIITYNILVAPLIPHASTYLITFTILCCSPIPTYVFSLQLQFCFPYPSYQMAHGTIQINYYLKQDDIRINTFLL